MKKVRSVLILLVLGLFTLSLPGSQYIPMLQPGSPTPAKLASKASSKPPAGKAAKVCSKDRHAEKKTKKQPKPAETASTPVPPKSEPTGTQPASDEIKRLPADTADPESGETSLPAVYQVAWSFVNQPWHLEPWRPSTATQFSDMLHQAEVRLVRVLGDRSDPDSTDAVTTADLHQPLSDRIAAKPAGNDPPATETTKATQAAKATDAPKATETAEATETPAKHASLSDLPGIGTPEAVVIPPKIRHRAAYEKVAESEGSRLLQPAWAAGWGFRLGGWMETGVSVVANNPADRYNGVVTFNDRDGEPQLNQLYFFLQRETSTDGSDWDLGGRVDFLFGTDARFTQAIDGLEEHWDQEARFYQAALPQFYLDVAFRDWILRMGHFYTILGYEVVPAPENFFYSHSYTMQYGEPFTHTGYLLIHDLGERLRLSAGLTRGNDQFDDTDGLDSVDFLGGLTWTSPTRRFSAAFGIATGEQGPGIRQTIYSLVGTWKASDRLRYVIQHDYGVTDVDHASSLEGDWYGLNQYFLYDLNERWAAGLRFEWFRDEDGTRVRGLGDGNLNQGPFKGDFFEVTAGLNWRPGANVLVRPEVRWDWYKSDVVAGPLPYDAGGRDDQFLFGCDLIVTY